MINDPYREANAILAKIKGLGLSKAAPSKASKIDLALVKRVGSKLKEFIDNKDLKGAQEYLKKQNEQRNSIK